MESNRVRVSTSIYPVPAIDKLNIVTELENYTIEVIAVSGAKVLIQENNSGDATIVVGGLEETGILELIANFIHKISGGNVTFIVIIIIWVSAVASAIIDNIPFSATMIPIIKSLATASGADLSVLAWTLALGTDIGGSATPIGASANVVGIAVASKNGHHISWKQYCTYAIPATLIVIAVSMLYIIFRYI